MGYFALSRPRPTKAPNDTKKGGGDAVKRSDDNEAKVGGGGRPKKKGDRKKAGAATDAHKGDDAGAKPKVPAAAGSAAGAAAGAAALKRPRARKERVDEPDCKKFQKYVAIPIAEVGEAEERLWLGQIRAVGTVEGVEMYSVFFEEDGDFLDYDVVQVSILFVILLCKF